MTLDSDKYPLLYVARLMFLKDKAQFDRELDGVRAEAVEAAIKNARRKRGKRRKT